MGQSFDPYYTWLGIPVAEQPPNYYRLLGIAPLEGNASVIEHAADRVMIHLRTFAAGAHGSESQRLLNEVAAARVCLLDPARKARYDADLQARLGLAPAAPTAATRMPPMPRAGANLPKAAPLPSMPVQVPVLTSSPVAVVVEEPVIAVNRSSAATDGAAAATRKAVQPSRKPDEIANPQAAAIINVVKIVMGGLGGLSMAVLLVWVVFRIDALGLFSDPPKPVVQNPTDTDPKPPTGNGNDRPVRPVEPVEPVEPRVPSTTPSTNPSEAEPVVSKPATPVEPANPFQPVVDPTEATPETPESTPSNPPTTPKTKTKIKSKTKPTSPAVPISPPETPVEPPKPVEPATPTTKVAADTRNPVPLEAEQKAKLEELKSVYSKEFEDAERSPGREKFPEFLISASDTIKSDQVARFVLLRQAYTRLIAAKDFSLAVDVIDRLERDFLVNPYAMRSHTLTEASKAGRQTPAEKLAIVLCAADLAESAVSRQKMSEAVTFARLAENLSKALQNKPLRERTMALKEEIEKAQSEWGPVERARQTLAASPDDAVAALVDGRYRCLVAGDWASGLPVLAKGGNDSLAVAARQDIAGASANLSATAIADAWFDLGKSDERLKPCYARALHWYRQALDKSTGAEQVPLLSRTELIETMNLPERYFASASTSATDEPLPTFASMYFRNVSFDPVDCFKFVLLPELKASPWNLYSGSTGGIYSQPDIVYGRVPAHVPNLPREYQVGVKAHHYYSSDQKGPFVIGMVGPKGQFAAVIDLPVSTTEYCTFLTLADAKTPEQNPTITRHTRQHLSFSTDPVVVQVRRNSVTVLVDNRVVCEYSGDLGKLALPREWAVSDTKALILGAHQASYRVTSWMVEPVGPASRLSRPGEGPSVPNLPGFPSP
ncbi:MAG: hypothetical protein L0211_23465 [Planctomycetaceae bacterium]|nr:hypothetical protein [Planctomycetaceae bacterium]